MSELWYFTCEGKQMEPVTTTELKQLATSGYLRGADLVWQEGMPAWVKAESIPGLIPPGAPQAVLAKSDTPAPRQPNALDDNVEPRSRRRRRIEDDELDSNRSIRRRPEPAKGMSGLALGLIIGGVALVVLVAIGAIVFVASSAHGVIPIDNFSIDLKPNEFHHKNYDFNFGTLYEFRVTSDRNTDVDLIIENAVGQRIAGDISEGPNSFLKWSPSVTGNYRVRIENLDQVQGNRSHVLIRSIGTSRGPVGNGLPFFGQPKINFQPPKGPGIPIGKKRIVLHNQVLGPIDTEEVGDIQPEANWEKEITFPVAKMIEVKVDSVNPDNDVDLYIFDQDKKEVASDTLRSHNCRTRFLAEANQKYRFEIRNLGPFPATCTLTYTTP